MARVWVAMDSRVWVAVPESWVTVVVVVMVLVGLGARLKLRSLWGARYVLAVLGGMGLMGLQKKAMGQ